MPNFRKKDATAMSGATITFNEYEFSANGRAHFSRQARYEPDAVGGKATRAVVTYTIAETFLEDTFAENQDKYLELLRAIRAAPEGLLIIRDEYDNLIKSVWARAQSDNLPDQWQEYLAEVNVVFEATEIIGLGTDAYVNGANLLKNITQWREAVRTERPSMNVNSRREAIGTVTAAGRIMADPQLPEADRRTFLQAQRQLLMGLNDHRDCRLKFGTFEQMVRIDSLEADVKDGSYDLEWSLSASYRRFGFVETEFEVAVRDDLEKGERITSLRGKTRATAITDAKTQALALIAYYEQGKARTHSEMTENFIASESDSTGPYTENYNEVTFTADYREMLGIVTWTLNVSTRKDSRSGVIITTYSGRVTAISAAAALDKAHEIATNMADGILLNSTETVQTEASSANNIVTTEVTFSYEFQTKGNWLFAEITDETDTQTFGQSTHTVSGSATALTKAGALNFARSFKPGGGLQLSARESSQIVTGPTGTGGTDFGGALVSWEAVVGAAGYKVRWGTESGVYTNVRDVGNVLSATIGGLFADRTYYFVVSAYDADGVDGANSAEHSVSVEASGQETQFTRVEFAYVFHQNAASGSIQYATEYNRDFLSRDLTTTISGTAYGPTEDAANVMINRQVSVFPTQGHIRNDQRTTNREFDGATDVLVSIAFSISHVGPLENTDGADILEAELTLDLTASINHTVMTPIPFGVAAVQVNCGTTIGLKVVSGSITALTSGTAKAWARGKRILLADGGYIDPPQERTTDVYRQFSGTDVKFHRVAFTYGARYQNLALT
jgi:hypothetical protein